MQVNNLNGELYASQYATGAGTPNPNNNGIANAAASPDCANGCDIVAEHSYAANEQPSPTAWANGTVVRDHRNGLDRSFYFNPQDPGASAVGQVISVTSTESAPDVLARTGSQQISLNGLAIFTSGLTGGSNDFTRNVQGTYPYFKTNYSSLTMSGVYNTPGQHVQNIQTQHCYGVGDCLTGAQVVSSAGGFRDDADEGTHAYDIDIFEDPAVFSGTCTTGCATGATTLTVGNLSNGGTQGEGRFLIDTNPAKVITTGTVIGGSLSGRHPVANFAASNFAVSTFLETAQSIPSQTGDVAPGTVTVGIVTTGVPAGFATNTVALPATSGVACVADASGQTLFETAAYTVVDGSHIQLTLRHPHITGATLAVGGLCGYGLEQKVDTLNGVRQVFSVIGSTSPTSLYYAGAASAYVGQQGFTSAYTNVNLVIASIARTGNVVSVTVAGNLPQDLNGLTLNVQGVADSSYNGSFAVTTTGPDSLTYTDKGPDSTTSGGTLTFLTGGYALYPMAEVVGVYNAATKAVDGQLTLAANTVAWAAGDPVEEPHYFQELVYPDTTFIDQTTPRPTGLRTAGISYGTNNGPGLVGYLISNTAPASNYFGNGGTHIAPDVGIQVLGPWQSSMQLQAGEQAVVHVNCNSHGCGRWNSGYNLFALDTGVGQDSISFAPQSSVLNFALRGTGYQFTPQAFTAGTINVTTLNAGSVHGLFTGTVQASSLPVFNASGMSHAIGAVPDPGATAGNTRFLREDGTWAAAVSSPTADLPAQPSLLGAYLMQEGTGTTLHDTSGQGNDATLNGPTWEGTQDLDFGVNAGSGLPSGPVVNLPTALNAAQTFMFLTYFPIEGYQTAPLAPGYGGQHGYEAILGGTSNKHVNLLTSLNERTFSYKFEAFNTDGTKSGEFMPPGWHVFVLTCGSAGVPAREFYDGAEVSSYERQGQATCPVPAAGNYVLGGDPVFSGQFFVGKFAGMWAWSTALSPSDAARASASALALLDAKGIARNFRPVVTTAPQLITIGDSRTIGYQLPAGADWPDQLVLTDPTYVKQNVAVTGEQTADMCNAFDLAYASRNGKGSGPIITTIFAGMSDLQIGSYSPQQIANNLHCVVTKAKQMGRVVLATEISGTGANTDAGKDALNTILRAQAFGWGVDNLADLATDPHFGPDGASANTACYPDNLHPGTACEPFITGMMQNSINELLGATETQRHQSTAASYQEVAGDRFLDLLGTSAQTVTLPDCTGYSLPRQVLNLGAVAATINTANSQTLIGPASIATGTRAAFLPVPNVPGTAGCKWERTQ